MASVTAYLDTRTTRKSGLYPIFILVSNAGKQKFIKTGYKIEPRQWAKNGVVKHENSALINAKISDLIAQANRYFAECTLNNRPANLDFIGTGKTSYSFPDYIDHRARQFAEAGKVIMETKYKRLAKELRACFNDIHFDEVIPDKLRELENYMIANGNSNNTRIGKFKFYGEILAQAVADGKAFVANPFKKYKIAKTEVRKEKLNASEIKCIELADLSGQVAVVRDMFLFSFYCKGARFADCLFIKHSEVKGDRIFFDTGKTGKKISVKIHSKLLPIINRYKGEFLFPFVNEIPDSTIDRIRLCAIWNTIVNRHLKIIAALCGIKKNVSFHIARHSFANQMKGLTDNITVIQESLGHSNIRTTQVYLESLGDERLDAEVGKLYGD